MQIFLNANRQLRQLWWVAIFFLVLAALTLPMILLSQQYHWEFSIGHQAMIVITATWICQLLRRKPISEILGRLNMRWTRHLILGLFAGALLMLVPAVFLYLAGYVSWTAAPFNSLSILSVTGVFVAVAVAEEFLFRGFIFQRLIAGTGIWPAQLIMAAYFLLVHLGNPGMTGSIKLLASINIFLASIMFGLAFLRTRSLALPIGMHFMANWTQGALLGFGVSGTDQASLLQPSISNASQWMTGGSFGLEASLPGLLSVMITCVVLYKWKPAGTAFSLHKSHETQILSNPSATT